MNFKPLPSSLFLPPLLLTLIRYPVFFLKRREAMRWKSSQFLPMSTRMAVSLSSLFLAHCHHLLSVSAGSGLRFTSAPHRKINHFLHFHFLFYIKTFWNLTLRMSSGHWYIAHLPFSDKFLDRIRAPSWFSAIWLHIALPTSPFH